MRDRLERDPAGQTDTKKSALIKAPFAETVSLQTDPPSRRISRVEEPACDAPSTPANPPKRGSSKSSTPSTPSGRPARPISRSQKHEGWQALADATTIAGFSGGNMERPALKRLLADIAAGKIDVVVVYKVDRLTRSLADFAKIVEVFDANQASFVSVTQAFNTTTQHGPADAERACCPSRSSSGRSPASASATRSPPRRRKASGWAALPAARLRRPRSQAGRSTMPRPTTVSDHIPDLSGARIRP